MRRIVPSRIAATPEQAKPALKEFISRRLEFPLGFPYKLMPAAVSIREFRKTKVTALASADLPPVRIEALLKAWLSNRAVQIRGDWDPGVLDADVLLNARGTVTPTGAYTVVAQAAALKAWWREWCAASRGSSASRRPPCASGSRR